MRKFEQFGISCKVLELAESAESSVQEGFGVIKETVELNQWKVLKAFHDNKISTEHFIGTNGYGYDDEGRDIIDRVFAQVFGTQDALVRYNFVNGTHAISTALWAVLRPGDTLVYIGKPYDTLEQVINGEGGSLKDFGVRFERENFDDLTGIFQKKPKVVAFQKSRGYSFDRDSISNNRIDEMIGKIKGILPETICIVDNCYGEFVEKIEPSADLIIGSLIKNPGGGIAQTGAYIAGNSDLIQKCANRLTAVGLGKHVGATLGQNREILQGLFVAPHIVGEALKTAIFTAKLFSLAGFEVAPASDDSRVDIIQAVKLGDEKRLLEFCRGVQSGAPINSFLTPIAWDMPGYDCPVVMAAGSFVQGASIELSADSALRPPYAAYLQGGLTYESAKIGVMKALENVLNVG